MTRPVAIIAFTLWIFGCGGEPGQVDADADRTTDELLVGTWSGEEVGAVGTTWTFAFTSAEFTVSTDGAEAYGGDYAADPAQNPSHIDVVITDSSVTEFIGKTSLGIYEIDGDTLTYAANEPGATARPTQFEAADRIRVFELFRQ